MTFDPTSEPVDYILLANRPSPGLATIAGANSPRRIDIRRGYALSGSRPVFRGIGLAKPIVTLRLFSLSDWIDWHDWKSLVQRPPRGERARAMDIWHPILEDQLIVSVLVEDVGQPMQTADGEWSIVIKFVEYRPPIQILAVLDGSDDEPLTGIELEIQEAQAEFDALAAIEPDES